MRKMETNDWMILNNIIYKIHTVENMKEMRRQLLDNLKLLIDFDSADFFLADKYKENHMVEPVLYNCEEDLSRFYEENDHSRGLLYGGKTLIYRETDVFSEDQRVQSDYYQKIYKPNNWHYSLQIIISKHREFVGVITLYRTIGKDNFKYDDIFMLDMLKDHLSYRLYQYKKSVEVISEKFTITEATEKFQLTHREHTILQLLMSGKDNLVISDELMITNNTLKKHILNIYRKLGIRNRVQLFKLIKENE